MAGQVLTVEVRLDQESLDALKSLEAAIKGMGGSAPEAEQAEAPKKESKPKADPKPKETKAETKAEAPKKPAVDREAIRAELKKLGALEGQGPALEILKKYGAATMGALKEEDFEKCFADVKAALATAEEKANAKDPLED